MEEGKFALIIFCSATGTVALIVFILAICEYYGVGDRKTRKAIVPYDVEGGYKHPYKKQEQDQLPLQNLAPAPYHPSSPPRYSSHSPPYPAASLSSAVVTGGNEADRVGGWVEDVNGAMAGDDERSLRSDSWRYYYYGDEDEDEVDEAPKYPEPMYYGHSSA